MLSYCCVLHLECSPRALCVKACSLDLGAIESWWIHQVWPSERSLRHWKHAPGREGETGALLSFFLTRGCEWIALFHYALRQGVLSPIRPKGLGLPDRGLGSLKQTANQISLVHEGVNYTRYLLQNWSANVPMPHHHLGRGIPCQAYLFLFSFPNTPQCFQSC